MLFRSPGILMLKCSGLCSYFFYSSSDFITKIRRIVIMIFHLQNASTFLLSSSSEDLGFIGFSLRDGGGGVSPISNKNESESLGVCI